MDQLGCGHRQMRRMALLWNLVFQAAFLIWFNLPGTLHEHHTEEQCDWDTFEPSCPANEVLIMQSAQYGRMNLGRCVKQNFGFLGCSIDVLHYVDSLCSGKNTCKFDIRDMKTELLAVKPCSELESHLQAGYSCVPVIQGRCLHHRHIQVKLTSGFLASHLADTMGLGTSRCPWIIEVEPGQRINISLVDFGTFYHNHNMEKYKIDGAHNEVVDTSSSVCKKYAILKEKSGKETTVCSSILRERTVYISESNSIEIQIVKRKVSSRTPQFLLKFAALGCPDISPPYGSQLDSSDDRLVITCPTSGQSWTLTCVHRKWRGEYANCTSPGGGGWSIFPADWTSSPGLLIVTITGIVIGVLLGTCLLVVALVCYRRRDRKKESQQTYAPPSGLVRHPYSSGTPSHMYGTNTTASSYVERWLTSSQRDSMLSNANSDYLTAVDADMIRANLGSHGGHVPVHLATRMHDGTPYTCPAHVRNLAMCRPEKPPREHIYEYID